MGVHMFGVSYQESLDHGAALCTNPAGQKPAGAIDVESYSARPRASARVVDVVGAPCGSRLDDQP